MRHARVVQRTVRLHGWLGRKLERCVAVAVRAPLSCRLGLCVPSLQGGSKVVSGDGEGVLGIYTWGLWGDTTDRLAPLVTERCIVSVARWPHARLLIVPPCQKDCSYLVHRGHRFFFYVVAHVKSGLCIV